MPEPGYYRELLNSDAGCYGGGNVGNEGGVDTEPIPAHGHAQSLSLTLPPLGGLLLKLAFGHRQNRRPLRVRRPASPTAAAGASAETTRTRLSALTSASVTGRFSFFTGTRSTTCALPVLSAGSG